MTAPDLRALLQGDVAASVVERLRASARTDPARVAFTFQGARDDHPEQLTYRELDRRAQAVANMLLAAGAQDQRALLLHPPGLDYIAALYGCLYAGVVAVPSYPPNNARALARLRAIAEDSDARFALTNSATLERARKVSQDEPLFARMRWLCTDEAEPPASELEPIAVPDHAVVLLQYTSGSTSAPKGVMLTHRHFASNLEQIAARGNMTSAERIMLWLPPYHDMGLVVGVLLPVWLGAQSYLIAPGSFLQRPARWLELVSRFGATLSGAPNFGYELCTRRIDAAKRAQLDLRSWRLAFNGAERVNASTLLRFADAFAVSGFDRYAFVPCYGLAEATLAVTFDPPGRAPTSQAFDLQSLNEGKVRTTTSSTNARTLVGLGRPVDGLELRIVDPESSARRPDGTIGEIWLRGENIARGYYQKTELTEQLFDAHVAGERVAANSNGFLRTGDLGFIHAGELFVVGRLKDLIIVAGVNYYPEDIEAAVAGCHPDLRFTNVAFSLEDRAREELVVVVEVDPAKHAPPAEIASCVRAAVGEALELPVHSVVLVRRGSVPHTTSGKLQRRACRDAYLGQHLALVDEVQLRGDETATGAPTQLVERMQRMLSELMGGEKIGPDEDLFASGFHSLGATQLVSRVRDQLRVDLDLRGVFEAPSARKLAALIHGLPVLPAEPLPTRIARDQPLPLSFSQERMWYLHRLDPAGAAYNVAGAGEVRGPIDVPAFKAALAELARRHEILRTNYPSELGEPRVVVALSAQLELDYRDVSSDPEPLTCALALAERQAKAPFEIAHELLARVALYRIGADRHVLAVTMHHLITDAWSMGVLLEELLALYEATRTGIPVRLPAQTIGYLDYAHFQRTQFRETELADQLAYWTTKLAGAVPLELPTDHARPQRHSSAGAVVPWHLPDGLLDGLRAVGAQQGATVFMVMLAAFDVLLQRYCDQSDLVIGVPIANRNRLSAEPLIGTLVNTLAVRLQVEPSQSFTELLENVREAALEAYAHQDLPFERLVSELPVTREQGRSPLVQVMFDYQNAPLRVTSTSSLQITPLHMSRGAAQFDLSLLIMDTDLGNLASVEYRTDLFEPSTIERMLGHYTNILQAIRLDPQQSIDSIRLMGPSERARTLSLAAIQPPLFERAPLASVPELFARHVLKTPDAPAVMDASGTLSYRELDERSQKLARSLRNRGAGPGQQVAVYLERSREVVVALLAVLRTGAAYVPLDPLYPPARIALILEDSDPTVVLTQASLLASLEARFAVRALAVETDAARISTRPGDASRPQLRPSQPVLPESKPPRASGSSSQWPAAAGGDWPSGREPSRATRDSARPSSRSEPPRGATKPGESNRPEVLTSEPPPDPNRVAYVLYTSGSTGRPKGVEVSMGALSNFLLSMAHTPGMTARDRLLAVTTVAFDISGLEIFLPLITGATAYVVAADVAADARALVRCIAQVRPTMMQATPATWKMLLEGGWSGDPQLTVLCGGEAFPRDLAQALVLRTAAVWNVYGPTETTIWSTIEQVRDGHGPVPIGRPIDRTSVYILDRNLQPVPVGVTGEIVIGGAGVAKGYFRQPQLTAQRFLVDPWSDQPGARMYRTGDRGRLTPDGTLYCLGRLDHQIKLRGYRIEPGEIEAALKQEFALDDAVVVALEARPGDLRLVAYCVAGQGSLDTPQARRDRLRRRIPDYMLPTTYVSLTRLPRTPNGKIDRKALPRPDETHEVSDAYEPPRDELETSMVRLWEQLLETTPIGIRDNFFARGGHSLLAVRLFARIERELGADMPLTLLLESQSVAELAQRVRETLTAKSGAPQLSAASTDARIYQHLRLLHRGKTDKPALYCVHGAGGSIFNLRSLAEQLGDGRSFFGLVAKGLDGVSPPGESIEELARSYLAEIRHNQPHGPYHLSGYCGGGLVAYEMARLLEQAGEKVGLVVLINTYHPQVDPTIGRARQFFEGVRRDGLGYLSRRSEAFAERHLAQAARELRIRHYERRNQPIPIELRDHWITQAFFRMSSLFFPKRYSGRLTIYNVLESDPLFAHVGPQMGWTGLANGGVDTVEIPGDHETCMHEQNATVLASKLRKALAAVDRDTTKVRR